MRRLRTVGSIALVAAAAWSGVWLIQRAVRTDREAQEGARLLDAVMLRVTSSFVDSVDTQRHRELATMGMLDEHGLPFEDGQIQRNDRDSVAAPAVQAEHREHREDQGNVRVGAEVGSVRSAQEPTAYTGARWRPSG